MGPDSERTFYEILGVDPSATKDEIKEAFHSLALLLHPDSQYYADIVDPTPTADQVELFKKITNAYHTLIDDDKRSAYDARIKKQTLLYEDDDDDAAIAAKLAELGLGEDVARIAGVRLDKPKHRPAQSRPSAHTGAGATPPPRSSTGCAPPRSEAPRAATNEWIMPKGAVKSTLGATNSSQPLPTYQSHKKIRSW